MAAHSRANTTEVSRERHIFSLSDEESRERFLLGGFAAFLAALASWLQVDLQVIRGPDFLLTACVSIVKLPILFAIGGFVAAIHTDERKPWKIAQLGIAAPAILLAGLLGANVNAQRGANTSTNDGIRATPTPTPVGWVFEPRVAYAHPSLQDEPKRFSLPDESRASQIWRGLTAQAPRRIYFVIVSQHDTLPEAQAAAKKLNEQELSEQIFKAEVYEPSGGYPSYAVVIGANLTLPEAENLRAQAIAAGVNPLPVWRLEE